MTQSKNAVAKKDDNALPAYLQGVADTTKDNFTSDDVAIPAIKLLQGTSPECQDFDAASPGVFWHTGLDIPLGKELVFIPCSRRRKYLLQAPLDDGQGVLARADDGETWDRTGEWTVQVDKKTKVQWKIDNLSVEKSGLTEWGTYDPTDEDSPPAATLFYDYLVLIPDLMDAGPVVISLARSAIKKAKKGLNDKIALHKNNGRPMQALMFLAKPVVENSPSGDFYNWSFTGAGFVQEEKVFNHAVDIGKSLSLFTVANEDKVVEEGTAKANSDKF
jgi:hypothetical protein